MVFNTAIRLLQMFLKNKRLKAKAMTNFNKESRVSEENGQEAKIYKVI